MYVSGHLIEVYVEFVAMRKENCLCINDSLALPTESVKRAEALNSV